LNVEVVLESISPPPCVFGAFDTLLPEVTGTSSITVKSEFDFGPADPSGDGFFLR
jgi:hypothetical protein